MIKPWKPLKNDSDGRQNKNQRGKQERLVALDSTAACVPLCIDTYYIVVSAPDSGRHIFDHCQGNLDHQNFARYFHGYIST